MNRLRDVHCANTFVAEADHLPEFASRNQIHCGHAEAGTENPVKGRGRPTALNVAKDADAHFYARSTGDGIANAVGDRTGAALLFPLLELYAFGNDDDGERLSLFFALLDVVANCLNGKRDLGNQNDVCATGHTSFEGDPARVAAHDFDDHDAVMSLGSGMNLVHGISGGG